MYKNIKHISRKGYYKDLQTHKIFVMETSQNFV